MIFASMFRYGLRKRRKTRHDVLFYFEKNKIKKSFKIVSNFTMTERRNRTIKDMTNCLQVVRSGKFKINRFLRNFL